MREEYVWYFFITKQGLLSEYVIILLNNKTYNIV